MILIFIVLHWINLQHYLTLSYIKQSEQILIEFYLQHRLLTVFIYTLSYVALTAISFPGAAIISLLGGALFGLWLGTIVVSFASTVGSAIAFLISRHVLKDYFSIRYAKKLSNISNEINLRGRIYLFSLRLNPVVPFFLVNIISGLTSISLWDFFWVSQLGMLPGTLLYVNAGVQLVKINSLSDVWSPEIFWSLLMISIFPVLIKKFISGQSEA